MWETPCQCWHRYQNLFKYPYSPRSNGSTADAKSLQSHPAAAAKSLQCYPTLCDPIDGSPPGSDVPGTLQERTLEWVAVAISFSNAWKWRVKVKSLSHVRLFMTPWTAAYQAPPSMGFSRQESWSVLPLPSSRSNGSVLANSVLGWGIYRITPWIKVNCIYTQGEWPRQCEDLRATGVALALNCMMGATGLKVNRIWLLFWELSTGNTRTEAGRRCRDQLQSFW